MSVTVPSRKGCGSSCLITRSRRVSGAGKSGVDRTGGCCGRGAFGTSAIGHSELILGFGYFLRWFWRLECVRYPGRVRRRTAATAAMALCCALRLLLRLLLRHHDQVSSTLQRSGLHQFQSVSAPNHPTASLAKEIQLCPDDSRSLDDPNALGSEVQHQVFNLIRIVINSCELSAIVHRKRYSSV